MLIVAAEKEQHRKIHCLYSLSQFANFGNPSTIIFPEGPKADGCFGVANSLKEMLILGNKKGSILPKVTTTAVRTFVSRRSSYANVVRSNL